MTYNPGRAATVFLFSVQPLGVHVTLYTEDNNFYDYYKRQLAYVILPDGSCLNKLLIREGYAKPEAEYYCKMLLEYERINFATQQARQGLYALAPLF
ncbi:MAG: thermonuclease family protein [Chitinophagales bacterium]|nr:thermonuclease family protein [Chitinophagales bacterium]